MKQLLFITVLVLAVYMGQAQTATAGAKKDIRQLKKEEHAEKITLRKLEGNEVSYRSKSNFAVDFSDATNVSWSREDFFDATSFTLDGKDTKAYYDAGGNLTGSINPASMQDLAADAQKDIQKHYAGYAIQKVIFYKDNETNDTDMILYGNQFDDADNYFVELTNGSKQIVLRVTPAGEVVYFKTLA